MYKQVTRLQVNKKNKRTQKRLAEGENPRNMEDDSVHP